MRSRGWDLLDLQRMGEEAQDYVLGYPQPSRKGWVPIWV